MKKDVIELAARLDAELQLLKDRMNVLEKEIEYVRGLANSMKYQAQAKRPKS